MKKNLLIFLLFFSVCQSFALYRDSIQIKFLDSKIEQLESQVKEIRRDELNYQLEKDLLKETYSNNYERINIVITIVLALIGLLGYLGIKDVTSIKKEYSNELGRLRGLQTELEAKVKEFGESKVKYDREITDIIKQNDEQNKKIKILELKEKIAALLKEKQYGTALEFCFAALDLAPQDLSLLTLKARIYTRTRNYNDSIKIYLKVLEIDPNYQMAVGDLAEVYLFNNQIEYSDALVEKHKQNFSNKASGKLLALFALLKLYVKKSTKTLLEETKKSIDLTDTEIKKRRLIGWDVTDAITFLALEPETSDRFILINYLLYLDGQLNGKEVLERLGKVTI